MSGDNVLKLALKAALEGGMGCGSTQREALICDAGLAGCPMPFPISVSIMSIDLGPKLTHWHRSRVWSQRRLCLTPVAMRTGQRGRCDVASTPCSIHHKM